MSITVGTSEIKDIYVGEGIDDYSAMQGPCPDGFHVPLSSERTNVINAGVTLGAWDDTSSAQSNISNYLSLPKSGYIPYFSSSAVGVGLQCLYWCSNQYNNTAGYMIRMDFSNKTSITAYDKGYGYTIRAFADVPVQPDSNWTVVYQGTGDAGIFSNSSLGLISISADGNTRYTLKDKNEGATNKGDYGKYFQWGNCYGFSASPTTSSTAVSAAGYGPGNYYTSSTFINVSAWDSSNNKNLRGGETGVVKKGNVKEVYVGTTKVRPTGWQPGANTLLYLPLEDSANDATGNYNGTWQGIASYSTLSSGQKVAYISGGNYIKNSNFVSLKQNLTLLVWLNPTANNGQYQPLFGQYKALSTHNMWSFQRIGGGANNTNFFFSTYGADSPTISISGWTLIAITYTSSGSTKIYKNGTQVISGTYVYNGGGSGYKIGGYYADDTGRPSLISYVSKVIVENKIRTAQEIQDYYDQTKAKYGL